MQSLSSARLPHRSPLHDARHGRKGGWRRLTALGGTRPRVDTRSKILTLAAALELQPPVAIATGYFDVLRVGDARELARVRHRPLLVIVLPLADEILPQRARAELVAALRVVDYVVTAGYGGLDRIVESLKPVEYVRMEAEHARRRALWPRQLKEHVHRRQTS